MAGQRAVLLAHGDIGSVPAYQSCDHFPGFRVRSYLAGKRQKLDGVFQGDVFQCHPRPQTRHLGFGVAAVLAELDIRAVAALLDVNGLARVGVFADHAPAGLGLCNQSQGPFHRQLVGWHFVGHRGPRPILTELGIGSEAADPDHDLPAVGVFADGDLRCFPRVDSLGGLFQQTLEAHAHDGAATARARTTEVEIMQPRDGFALTSGDGVEFVLHAGGEIIVDQIR